MPNRDRSAPVRKSFEITAGEMQENRISGVASVCGVLDRSRDVIFPGAWGPCLAGFRANGFVAVGHDWSALPVAMPVSVKEAGNQLQTEAEFHSTQAAQDARTVCKERLDKGLSVGLSVGFMFDWSDDDSPAVVPFESGQKLLDFAKTNGYDMSLFDQKGIRACDGWCWGILKIAELIEYSIVPCPCNPLAGATDAKGCSERSAETVAPRAAVKSERDFEALLRDAGFSRREATAITLHGFKALQRDAGDRTDPTDTQPDGAGETETPTPDDPAEAPADAPAAEISAKTLTPEEVRALELRFRTLSMRHGTLMPMSAP